MSPRCVGAGRVAGSCSPPPSREDGGPVHSSDPITRTVYATDNSIYQIEPESVLVASSADEIATLLAENHKSARPKPVVARGGGTGTNGQSLTDGVVVDLKRQMNRVLSVDAQARVAVVEPGVVTAELNAQLAPLGLHWAPHTSTLNRATVGGMISTDAAGKGSLVYGRAHRHVLALDVLLADGTPWRAEPVTIAEGEARAQSCDSGGQLWRRLLDLPVEAGDEFGFPELARGFSGYGLDRLRHDDMIDPVALLAGAEGTLAVITAATIRLTPLPLHTLLVVASYPSFQEALADAVDLRATAPTAIETFDERTLEQGRSSPAWPALGTVVGEHRGSVLLLEYTGDEEPDLGPVFDALRATGRSTNSEVLADPADRTDAWKVRADAVGLLAKVEVGGPERSARPTAFVEDCAVPVASMGEFIADFRSVLDSFGVEYAMFGHADVGCVHVRPALDTTDPGHERMVREITQEVVRVVARHGGVLWGEHGRGFRGESVRTFLTPATIEIMRQVKTAFDPRDLLNPGKLYRPFGADEPILALDSVPLRGHANRSVPVEVRRQFAPAFACNGNGLCHHYDGAEVMCPSFKASGDPALSPKGRADLVREWLRRRAEGGDPEFEDGLAANLDQCLSCSACSGRCPVEVDISELKSRFLDAYYQGRRRPVSHVMLSRFEQLAVLGSRAPALARLGRGPAGRLLGLVDLPAPKGRTEDRLPAFDPASARSPDLVLLADVFTSVLDPDTLARSADVLTGLGYVVARSPFVASGKFDHVKGRRTPFGRAVAAQAALVWSIVEAGAVPVGVEPATALLHQHEYPAMDAHYPQECVRPLVDVLVDRVDRIETSGSGPVTLLGHCTERATRPSSLAGWRQVLEAAGYDVATPAVGCCGMAGIFGHETANQTLSRQLWDLSWAEPASGPGPVVTTGYSCRSQADRMAGIELGHPIDLL
ncbi:MAG: FAD-binding oxidoreductase [Actinomycetia bacterium]|nr:FAD-binding oxidoreductase [Actinomycetes bacterium]